MTSKTNRKTKSKLAYEQMTSDQKFRKLLEPHAVRIANEACMSINGTVPAYVDGMHYARQWVLEEAIRLLQARV